LAQGKGKNMIPTITGNERNEGRGTPHGKKRKEHHYRRREKSVIGVTSGRKRE